MTRATTAGAPRGQQMHDVLTAALTLVVTSRPGPRGGRKAYVRRDVLLELEQALRRLDGIENIDALRAAAFAAGEGTL